MPNGGTRAALNHLELPLYNIETSNIHKITQLTDHSALVSDRGTNNSWTLTATIEDEVVYRQVQEFCSNASWTAAMTFASLAEDGIEMNGVYSLLNSTVKQGAETWAEPQWTLSGKYRRLNWMIEGDSIDTDWDTLDNVSDGAFGNLRNDTENGAVADHGTEILIPASASLQWGDWWDSTIDWTCSFYTTSANADIRFYWRKCTAANSLNGGYYLEVDDTNNYLRVHYIDTAGTDTILYTYSVSASYLGEGTHPITATETKVYTVQIITAGHRFDIYFGIAQTYDGTTITAGEECYYRFSVFDDRLTSGQECIYTGADSVIYVDDILVSQYKPAIALLPAGAYAWNDIPHQPMMRLDDNCTAYGRGQTVIAPQGNLTFKVGQALATIPKTEGLWIADGQTTIYDQSGHDRHMILTGSVYCYEQGAYNFPVSIKTFRNNIANYYHSSTTNIFSLKQGYTVHLLVKPIAVSISNGYFLLLRNDTVGHNALFINIDTSNMLHLEMTDSAAAGVHWWNVTTLTLNEWQLLTITFDGLQDHAVYINGHYVTSRNYGSDLNFDTIETVRAFGSSYLNYEGNMSLVQILSYAQSATDIAIYARQLQLLRNDQSAVKVWDTGIEGDGDWDFLEAYLTFDEGFSQQVYDLSKYNRIVTENSWTNKQDDGTDGWSSSSYHKNALYCYHVDGAADYLQIAAMGGWDIDNGITLGCWVKFDSVAVAAQGIWDIYDNTSGTRTITVEVLNNGKIFVEIPTGGTDGQWTSTAALVADRWYFIVVTFSGLITETPIIYVNGAVFASTETQAPSVAALYDIDGLYIGVHDGYVNGFIDDCFIFSKALSASRIAWLYQHMPCMIDESQWTQVFSADHQFVGDMVIDNGQIRLSQTFRQINGSTTYHTKLSPYLWGYSDGHWWIENKAYPLYYAAGTADILESHSPWQLTKLDKYTVEVKGRVANTSEWLQYHMIMTQSPLLTITEDQYSLQGNVNVYMVSRTQMESGAMGTQTAPRFMTPTLDAFGDTFINTTVTGGASTGNGLSIGLHREVPLLWLFTDTRYTSSVQGQAVAGQYSMYGFVSSAGIDYDVDELPHSWIMGMLPFSQPNHVLGGDPANWTNENGVSIVGAWATINNGTNFICSSGAGAGNVVTSIDITVAAAGTYRAWFLLITSLGTEDGTIAVTNAAYYNGSAIVTNVTNAGVGTWYGVDCICSDADVINYTFQKTSVGAGEFLILGEVILVPISNSKNFPLDVWHQALRQSRITESVSSH